MSIAYNALLFCLGCSNNSNTFKLHGFHFDRKILETWESNVSREGWKAKVGDDIILRSRSGHF